MAWFPGNAAPAVDFSVREIRVAPARVELAWEGPTGSIYTIKAAEYLAPYDTFAPLVENIPAAGIFTSNNFPRGPDPSRYYRVIEQGGATNRLGKIVLMSDFHLSPFLNRATTEALATNDVSLWDGYFAATTNGYFTPDATRLNTDSPLLLNSAIANAHAACPNPDAILVPGDFPDYLFIDSYNYITETNDAPKGKVLFVKTTQYALMKIRQTFPNAPVYFALGNNDTYSNDYDIAPEGDEYYTNTAPVFYQGPFTNLLSYTDFAATYTNTGNYTAPFGRGDIISLESLYFSSSYPNGPAPGSNQLVYLETELLKSAASNRHVWLLFHIPPGIDANATWSHWQTGDTAYVSTDWAPGFIAPFCEIVSRYTNTISGIFCGHYHDRGWHLLSDPVNSNVIATVQIANGLLFNHGNNPGFSVLTYDRQTLALINESTYSLDYATWYGSLDTNASWSLRYSMNQGNQIADLSAASLLPIWSGMRSSTSDGFNYFNSEYTGGRTPLTCTASNWPVYYNAIRWTLPQQFLDNQ